MSLGALSAPGARRGRCGDLRPTCRRAAHADRANWRLQVRGPVPSARAKSFASWPVARSLCLGLPLKVWPAMASLMQSCGGTASFDAWGRRPRVPLRFKCNAQGQACGRSLSRPHTFACRALGTALRCTHTHHTIVRTLRDCRVPTFAEDTFCVLRGTRDSKGQQRMDGVTSPGVLRAPENELDWRRALMV